jgi:hypothetical protein
MSWNDHFLEDYSDMVCVASQSVNAELVPSHVHSSRSTVTSQWLHTWPWMNDIGPMITLHTRDEISRRPVESSVISSD